MLPNNATKKTVPGIVVTQQNLIGIGVFSHQMSAQSFGHFPRRQSGNDRVMISWHRNNLQAFREQALPAETVIIPALAIACSKQKTMTV
jgi:hypothetical protein